MFLSRSSIGGVEFLVGDRNSRRGSRPVRGGFSAEPASGVLFWPSLTERHPLRRHFASSPPHLKRSKGSATYRVTLVGPRWPSAIMSISEPVSRVVRFASLVRRVQNQDITHGAAAAPHEPQGGPGVENFVGGRNSCRGWWGGVGVEVENLIEAEILVGGRNFRWGSKFSSGVEISVGDQNFCRGSKFSSVVVIFFGGRNFRRGSKLTSGVLISVGGRNFPWG